MKLLTIVVHQVYKATVVEYSRDLRSAWYAVLVVLYTVYVDTRSSAGELSRPGDGVVARAGAPIFNPLYLAQGWPDPLLFLGPPKGAKLPYCVLS